MTQKKEEKYLQQTFDPQHAINLQESNVFDILLSDGDDSQGGVNENPVRIDKDMN